MAYLFKNLTCYHKIFPRFEEENDYIEIDELIAPAIILLNKKGYITEFCCSGHLYPTEEYGEIIKENQCYIKFTKDYFSGVEKLPKDFYYYKSTKMLEKLYPEVPVLERMDIIFTTMKDLYLWSSDLLVNQ